MKRDYRLCVLAIVLASVFILDWLGIVVVYSERHRTEIQEGKTVIMMIERQEIVGSEGETNRTLGSSRTVEPLRGPTVGQP